MPLCYHTSISNIVGKLNKDYKPLVVALVLAAGGLFVGGIFIPHLPGTHRTDAFAESFFIPQAQGAEVDVAALAVASVPFLASANSGLSASSVPNVNALYDRGAIRDTGAFVASLNGGQHILGAQGGKKSLAYGVIYQVVAGDTLGSIARQFNVSAKRIVQFNPSVNFSSLIPGISIIIPGRNDVNVFTLQG